jgi:alkylation response protein AidB-like acyl-CoA dehydrogenase
MDLTYPDEAESFRVEIREWLEENLPPGWFDPGFAMSEEERQAFNQTWTEKLFKGGWICAGWPEEYGGSGRLERGVHQGQRPDARRLLRRHPGRTDLAAVGH